MSEPPMTTEDPIAWLRELAASVRTDHELAVDIGADVPAALARALIQAHEALQRETEFIDQYTMQYLAESKEVREEHAPKDGRSVPSGMWCCRAHWLESMKDQARAAITAIERLSHDAS